MRPSHLSLRRCFALAAALTVAACASKVKLQAPSLAVERLKVAKVQITGAGLVIGFRLRNVNAEPIRIDRFQYDFVLNGHRLGRGYVTEPIDLDGFAQGSVESRFDLNILQLPGTVKAILDQDRAVAEVTGVYYARAAGKSHQLDFRYAGDVPLDR